MNITYVIEIFIYRGCVYKVIMVKYIRLKLAYTDDETDEALKEDADAIKKALMDHDLYRSKTDSITYDKVITEYISV